MGLFDNLKFPKTQQPKIKIDLTKGTGTGKPADPDKPLLNHLNGLDTRKPNIVEVNELIDAINKLHVRIKALET